MEGQQVLESFDSLWFFATVFSSRTPPPPAVERLESATQNEAVEPPGEETATPILEKQENVESKTMEDGFGLGCEMKTEEKEEKRRKSRRRRSLGLGQRRKIVGDLDLISCAVKEICECWLFEERIGNGNGYQRKKKMPPFEDSMAMKEHIRSWAYAVACTVR